MLNKKAIAAFAAGATLLSGMALAAPAFVSAPAFAETQKSAKAHLKDLEKTMNDTKGKYESKKAEYDAAKTTSDKSAATRDELKGKQSIVTDENGTFAGAATGKYTLGADKVTVTVAAGGDEAQATAATAYLKAAAQAKTDKAATDKLEAEVTPLKAAYDAAVLAYNAANTTTTEAD